MAEVVDPVQRSVSIDVQRSSWSGAGPGVELVGSKREEKVKALLWKRIAWIAGGGIAGFAWYYFVGCTTGACPISSNPYISTGYGALIAAIATAGNSRSGRKQGNAPLR